MLTFEKEDHIYKYNGIKVPSVTQIIKEAGLSELNSVPQEILEEKADIGNKVHKATELYDRDNLDVDSIHPILLNYVSSWEKFRKDFQFIPEEIELELVHNLYRFAGRVDRVGTIYGKKSKVIVDIKTGMKLKSHSLQTAGYKLLYEQNGKISKRFSVYLTQEDYKISEHKNRYDENVFLAALTITNYKRGA